MYSQESSVILIVDDNLTNLDVLSECLMEAGFEIAVATNGEDAIQQSMYDPPDLILLDVMMPGIDGFETFQRLKDNAITHEIPVIFMTALNEPTQKIKAFKMGAVDYITKPFHSEEVFARVNLQLKVKNLTKKLAEKNNYLLNFSAELELKVQERTAELTRSLDSLQQAQLQLVQSEKMSALGQLVAGVAHEINNPLTSIRCNISYVKEYFENLIAHLKLYQQYYPNPVVNIKNHANTIELDFLTEDLPKLISAIGLGADRIHYISNSLRTFSRSDAAQRTAFNMHEGIDSTLLLLKHKLEAKQHRSAIEVVKQYGDLPLVCCYPGQINQLFMNILANAIDALETPPKDKPQIEICTKVLTTENTVEIRIKDNGVGIPLDVQPKIFDYLFTTKGVGQGTGLGLSISKQIVESKHGGKLGFVSTPGEGTEFAIALPID